MTLPATMLAVRVHAPGELRVERVPVPKLEPGDALVKVAAAGICTTDRKIAAKGHFKLPVGTVRTLGHEVAGEIVAIGSEVRGLEVGMKVALAPNLGCGRCRECAQGKGHLCADYDAFGITLDGGMAEYLRLPARAIAAGNVLPLPEGFSLTHAALLEPLSCCYNALSACALQAGESLLVIGAGAMGLMNVAMGKAFGASPILASDPHRVRRERALSLGADVALEPDPDMLTTQSMKRTEGRGVDVIVVAAASTEAVQVALAVLARKGRLNLFAGFPSGEAQLSVDANALHYRQLLLTGTSGSSLEHFRRTLALAAAGRFNTDALITGYYPLSAAEEAFKAAASREHARVVLEP